MEREGEPEELEARIRRVQDAIEKGQATPVQLLGTVLAAAGAHAVDRVTQKLQRRLAREREREERRRRREQARLQSALPQGLVFAAATVAMLFFAVTRPALWWLVFVAFGFGIASANLISTGLRKNREQADALAGEPAAERGDPALAQIAIREQRVQAAAERLLGEWQGAPQAVRDFVQRPEKTVKALRSASQELARRERELRSALKPEDDERLRSERAGLAARVDAEKDEVARTRLRGALLALDGQLAQRAELATAASRFEAEGTRILYTLENLRTQILRARSADAASSDVAGAGLRQSLAQLSEEMDAVAQALEEAHRGEPTVAPPLAEVTGPDDGAPPNGRGKLRGR